MSEAAPFYRFRFDFKRWQESTFTPYWASAPFLSALHKNVAINAKTRQRASSDSINPRKR